MSQSNVRSQTPDCCRFYPSLFRWAVMLSILCLLLWTASPLLSLQRGRGRGRGNVLTPELQSQSYSRRHLHLINLMLLQYTADNDGQLPALDSAEKLKKQLAVYRFSGGNLICPISNKPYGLNKNLAGKKLDSITDRANTLLVWSPKAAPDGTYTILDARGYDRRVGGGELAKMKRVSHVQ